MKFNIQFYYLEVQSLDLTFKVWRRMLLCWFIHSFFRQLPILHFKQCYLLPWSYFSSLHCQTTTLVTYVTIIYSIAYSFLMGFLMFSYSQSDLFSQSNFCSFYKLLSNIVEPENMRIAIFYLVRIKAYQVTSYSKLSNAPKYCTNTLSLKKWGS